MHKNQWFTRMKTPHVFLVFIDQYAWKFLKRIFFRTGEFDVFFHDSLAFSFIRNPNDFEIAQKNENKMLFSVC